jgi:hypothetical protein
MLEGAEASVMQTSVWIVQVGPEMTMSVLWLFSAGGSTMVTQLALRAPLTMVCFVWSVR